MQVNSVFKQYYYVRLPCEPGKKAACLHEGDYAAGHAITLFKRMYNQLYLKDNAWVRVSNEAIQISFCYREMAHLKH